MALYRSFGIAILFICPNIPPMLEAHYAVPLIGAALVSINIRLSVGEVSYIIKFTKSHLARFKAPKYVEFGELPKTATGKIQKFKLRDREWQGRARIN